MLDKHNPVFIIVTVFDKKPQFRIVNGKTSIVSSLVGNKVTNYFTKFGGDFFTQLIDELRSIKCTDDDFLSALNVCGYMCMLASSVVMGYIFTNHLPNPLCEHSDPLIGSTSVIVPRWIDWLHVNFSYHTEHYVFPA